ncbi:OmpA family protein [Ostertagia ostertagi]
MVYRKAAVDIYFIAGEISIIQACLHIQLCNKLPGAGIAVGGIHYRPVAFRNTHHIGEAKLVELDAINCIITGSTQCLPSADSAMPIPVPCTQATPVVSAMVARRQKTPDSTYNIDIALQPLAANASIILKNIFFDVNKFQLKPESQVELDNVVLLLKENPSVKIQINGYTDNAGRPADNITLSNNRAKAVVEYISNKGIDAKRMSYQGFGEKMPLADNSSEEGRARNRRTELKVVSQ